MFDCIIVVYMMIQIKWRKHFMLRNNYSFMLELRKMEDMKKSS